jgi:TldD protein
MSLPGVAGPLVADARRLLLAPAGLDDAHLSRVLASIHTHDVDFADLYFQYSPASGGYDKQAFAQVFRRHGLVALEEAARRAPSPPGAVGYTAIARGGAHALYAPQDPVGSLTEGMPRCAARAAGADGARARSARHAGMASLAGEYEAVLTRATAVAAVRPSSACVRRHRRGEGGAAGSAVAGPLRRTATSLRCSSATRRRQSISVADRARCAPATVVPGTPPGILS